MIAQCYHREKFRPLRDLGYFLGRFGTDQFGVISEVFDTNTAFSRFAFSGTRQSVTYSRDVLTLKRCTHVEPLKDVANVLVDANS